VYREEVCHAFTHTLIHTHTHTDTHTLIHTVKCNILWFMLVRLFLWTHRACCSFDIIAPEVVDTNTPVPLLLLGSLEEDLTHRFSLSPSLAFLCWALMAVAANWINSSDFYAHKPFISRLAQINLEKTQKRETFEVNFLLSFCDPWASHWSLYVFRLSLFFFRADGGLLVSWSYFFSPTQSFSKPSFKKRSGQVHL